MAELEKLHHFQNPMILLTLRFACCLLRWGSSSRLRSWLLPVDLRRFCCFPGYK
jgi:hypothetical protein